MGMGRMGASAGRPTNADAAAERPTARPPVNSGPPSQPKSAMHHLACLDEDPNSDAKVAKRFARARGANQRMKWELRALLGVVTLMGLTFLWQIFRVIIGAILR